MTETRIPRRTRRRSRMPVLLLLCAAVLVAGLLAAVVISLRPVKVPDPEPKPFPPNHEELLASNVYKISRSLMTL